MIFVLILPLLLFAWLAWRWFESAVALLVFLIPAYLLRTSVLGVPTNFWELALAIVIVMGFLKIEVRSRWRATARKINLSFTLPFLLFIVAAIISTIISPVPRVSLGILKGWIILPIIFGFLVFTVKEKSKIFRALIFSGVVTALLALSQIGHLERLRSIYDVPNSLALWLAPILVIALWLGWQKERLYLLLAIPIGAALIGTQSIMGATSVVFALATGVIVNKVSSNRHGERSETIPSLNRKNLELPRNDAVITLIVLMLVSSLYLVWSGKINYFARPFVDHGYTNSASVRLQLWSISLDLIKDHPLLGVGLGQFEPAYQVKLHERFIKYQTDPMHSSKPIPEFVFRDPHNWVLSFWLNTGLFGLLSFLSMTFMVVLSLSRKRGVQQAAALAIIAILIFGLTDTIYWKNDLAVLFWILYILSQGRAYAGRRAVR